MWTNLSLLPVNKYGPWLQVGDSTMYGETVAVLLRSLGQVKGVSPFSASTFLGHYNDW